MRGAVFTSILLWVFLAPFSLWMWHTVPRFCIHTVSLGLGNLINHHAMRHRLVLLLSLMLLPLLALCEVNWVFQFGGMYKESDSFIYWDPQEPQTYEIIGGLHLQIPVSPRVPLFIETGLDYRYKNGIFEQLDNFKLNPDKDDWYNAHDYLNFVENGSFLEVPLKVGYKLSLNEKNAFEFGLGPYGSYCISPVMNDHWSVGLTSSVVFRHRCMSFGLSYSNPIFLNGPRDYDIHSLDLTIGINFGNKAWGTIGKVAAVTGMVAAGVGNAYVQNYGKSASYQGNSSYSDSDSGSSSSSRAGNSSSSGFSLSEQQAYNTDKSTYAKYDSQLSNHFSGNRTMKDKDVKDIQKKMKKLREKWEARGKSFPQAPNETK